LSAGCPTSSPPYPPPPNLVLKPRPRPRDDGRMVSDPGRVWKKIGMPPGGPAAEALSWPDDSGGTTSPARKNQGPEDPGRCFGIGWWPVFFANGKALWGESASPPDPRHHSGGRVMPERRVVWLASVKLGSRAERKICPNPSSRLRCRAYCPRTGGDLGPRSPPRGPVGRPPSPVRNPPLGPRQRGRTAPCPCVPWRKKETFSPPPALVPSSPPCKPILGRGISKLVRSILAPERIEFVVLRLFS